MQDELIKEEMKKILKSVKDNPIDSLPELSTIQYTQLAPSELVETFPLSYEMYSII
jgi:hypothetical protein